MRRVFQFVDHRDGIVLNGNPAVTVRIDQELVCSKPKLSGPLARLHFR